MTLTLLRPRPGTIPAQRRRQKHSHVSFRAILQCTTEFTNGKKTLRTFSFGPTFSLLRNRGGRSEAKSEKATHSIATPSPSHYHQRQRTQGRKSPRSVTIHLTSSVGFSSFQDLLRTIARCLPEPSTITFLLGAKRIAHPKVASADLRRIVQREFAKSEPTNITSV